MVNSDDRKTYKAHHVWEGHGTFPEWVCEHERGGPEQIRWFFQLVLNFHLGHLCQLEN